MDRLTCPRATGCSPSRRPTKRSPASIASTPTTRRTPRRAREIAARALRRRARAAAPARHMQPLRIAHVAPVATGIPPPKSGSVQTMTSLLTEGLVARGHDVTLFATGDSTTTAQAARDVSARLLAGSGRCGRGRCTRLLNIAAAVERAREFDIIHYEAGYYPMSLAFTRLSPTPVVQTLHHAPTPAEVALWRRYPEAPFIAISREQARLLAALNVAGIVLHGIDTDRFTFRAAARRLPAVPRPLHRRQRTGAGDRGGQADRHAAAAGRRRRAVLSRARGAAGRRRADRLRRRSRLRHQGAACTAARARCSTRFRPANRSASCWPKRWPAARRSPRSIAARFAKSSTTASPAECSTTLDAMVDGLPAVLTLDRHEVRDARSRASASCRWSTATWTRSARFVAQRRSQVTLTPLPIGTTASWCSPSSPTPTTSRWRAAGRWRGWPTPERTSS